jgi:DNA-binding MarR family transcriptional regulator
MQTEATELDDMPGHLVRRLQQIAVAIFHIEMDRAGIDLTPVQYAALARIRDHDGLDQATLAGLIAYDRATITGVVDRLVQKGLISREISATDRRARVLALSDQGRDVVDRAQPPVEQAQKTMLRGLDPDEAATFITLLRKATTELNDLSRAPLRKSPK